MRMKNYISDHQVEILAQLNKERNSSQNTCDVTLIVGSHEFAAHRCILAALSTFFKKLFTCEMKEKYENKANIKGVDEKTMEIILNFIYSCRIEITSENVYNLLQGANFLDMKNLKNYCADFLFEEINSDNCLSMRAYAKLYNIDELAEKVDVTIKENFEAVIQGKEFKELEFDEISKMMQTAEKQASSEEIVFHALIGWINHKPTTRQGELNKVFNLLKIDHLSLDFLHNVVAKQSLIMDSKDCLKLCFLSSVSPHRAGSTRRAEGNIWMEEGRPEIPPGNIEMKKKGMMISIGMEEGRPEIPPGNIGMEEGRIPDSSITASSSGPGQKNLPHLARLNQQPVKGVDEGCWVPLTASPGEWIQVLLGDPTRLRGVSTQGNPCKHRNEFVKTYKIAYGDSEDNMRYINDGSGSDKIFQGNTDCDTEVTNLFPKPVTARYFRAIVQSWSSHPALRMEFIL